MPGDPNEKGRNYRGAKDDAQRGSRQVLPRRQPGELHLEEFEVIGDRVQIDQKAASAACAAARWA